MDAFRWDCNDGRNCFSRRCRLKFEHFTDLPGGLRPTDGDFLLESGGCMLFQEWKFRESPAQPLEPDSRNGQLIMAKKVSALQPNTFIFVRGDAEYMTCEEIMIVAGGKAYEWEPCDFDELNYRTRLWAEKQQRRKGRTG